MSAIHFYVQGSCLAEVTISRRQCATKFGTQQACEFPASTRKEKVSVSRKVVKTSEFDFLFGTRKPLFFDRC